MRRRLRDMSGIQFPGKKKGFKVHRDQPEQQAAAQTVAGAWDNGLQVGKHLVSSELRPIGGRLQWQCWQLGVRSHVCPQPPAPLALGSTQVG